MNSSKVKHMRDLSSLLLTFFSTSTNADEWLRICQQASNKLLIPSSGTKYAQGKAQGGGLSVLEKPAGVCTTTLKKITQVFCLVFPNFQIKELLCSNYFFDEPSFLKHIWIHSQHRSHRSVFSLSVTRATMLCTSSQWEKGAMLFDSNTRLGN